FRGLTGDNWSIGEPEETLEKPWLAAVDAFAIGGGCQLLLVVDYVVAEAGAYCNLPARKEGIIPGAANLRLPRFVGERAAREGILFDKTFYVDSPEAAGLINEVVPHDQLMSRSEEIATRIAEMPPLAVRMMKEFAIRFRDIPVTEAWRVQTLVNSLLTQLTTDGDEGRKAFLEKRPARFR
ncbi:MAG: hypothetical protein IH914_06080, partial [candidate division Zixibacteria bacterium]|nr:hypothetical protein [candidate division Zixibacteria bacterium]